MENLLPTELVALATTVIEKNRAAGRRITVAESCTGGLVAAALTEVPGSSDVFDCGFNTYSNDAKQKMLGVSSDLLETFGAVSIAVAWEMAQGALKHSDCDVAVAITGVAGPGGKILAMTRAAPISGFRRCWSRLNCYCPTTRNSCCHRLRRHARQRRWSSCAAPWQTSDRPVSGRCGS